MMGLRMQLAFWLDAARGMSRRLHDPGAMDCGMPVTPAQTELAVLACRRGHPPWRIFDAGVGWLALAPSPARCSREALFYGLLFALIADKSLVLVSEPITGVFAELSRTPT
jgi:hypothetical protein